MAGAKPRTPLYIYNLLRWFPFIIPPIRLGSRHDVTAELLEAAMTFNISWLNFHVALMLQENVNEYPEKLTLMTLILMIL